jgi:NaMN:DMB phosphoribosyltransferase
MLVVVLALDAACDVEGSGSVHDDDLAMKVIEENRSAAGFNNPTCDLTRHSPDGDQ